MLVELTYLLRLDANAQSWHYRRRHDRRQRIWQAGKIEYRADSAGNINIRVGNVAFDAEQLTENVSAMLRHITDSRPASVKGDFVTNITLSSTMGPGVRIAV